MNVWVVSAVILFGLAELCHWIAQFTPPLPVFILGGAFLAIASNHDKQLPFGLNFSSSESMLGSPDQEPDRVDDTPIAAQPNVDLPSFSGSAVSPDRPISFEIKPRASSATDLETSR